MKCGMHIVTVNPYVMTKRRKDYGAVTKEYDLKINKFDTQIDSVYQMARNEAVENLPWNPEDMSALISLSEDAQERATMLRGFLQNSLHMRPAFPRPEPRDRWAVRAYNKYVTRAEKRLFLVRNGPEEYFYTLPDGML